MRKIIFLLIFTTTCVFSQKGKFFFETNYNTFSHSSLKEFQNEFIKDITFVSLNRDDDFPSNIGFSAGYKISKFNTAFFVAYNTTGGKISYSDFSGLIRVSEELKGYTVGGEYQLDLRNEDYKGDFFVGFRGFVTFSSLEIDSHTQIGTSVNEDFISFSSRDFGLGTRIIYEYPISFFKFRVILGFDYVIGGELKFDDNNDFYLQNNKEEKVKTGWTGLRTGIGFSIPI